MKTIHTILGNAVLGAAICALTISQAQAAQPRPRFTLTMFDNGFGAHSLQSGDYAAAVSAIKAGGSVDLLYTSIAKTNMCVAQAMLGKLEVARRACDDAVREAIGERSARPWAVASATTRDSC